MARGLGSRALVVLALFAACGKSTPERPAFRPDVPTFPHDVHPTLSCSTCHETEDVLAGRPATPVGADHKPCSDAGCHAADFKRSKGSLCKICHTEQGSRVRYPPERSFHNLPARFSHEQHLDYGAMEAAVGFHVSCTDCHESTNDAPTAPGHAVCARCHAPEARTSPRLDRCSACHVKDTAPAFRQRELISGDLKFAHVTHQRDRAGKAILCSTCHTASRRARDTGRHPKPETAACVACHDDDKRTPVDKRMSRCETCHATRVGTFRSVPPRSHLPPAELPEDHTMAFRRDHELEARDRPWSCAECHKVMSGSALNSCDECHRATRPQNHDITWREFDHGPAAAADRRTCARCHTAEFCIGCHASPPRSHFPLMEFRAGGHALNARIATRSCLACHDPDTSCAACHVRGAP